MDGDDVAGLVLLHALAADDVAAHQTHLAPQGQALELRGRHLSKVLPLDPQLLGIRDFFAQHFPGVVVTELEGTYLVWCDFRCFGMSDADMKVFLTDECMLYLDNGTDFGAAGSGYQRINVACPRKTLADALDRFYQAARKRGMAR